MSKKTKWKWIAQSSNGFICKYDHYPSMTDEGVFYSRGGECLVVQAVINWNLPHKWILINLDEYDYEISKGILIKIDKLISIDEICKAFSVPLPVKHSHYKKDVRHLDYIDVYRIIELYELHDPCFQHALKKILVPGARGHKDLINDINDIIDTMQRKLEMMAENEKKL